MVLVAKSKKSRRRRARNIALVVIMCLVFAGIAALFVSLGYYVSSLDTIFPNVWAEGIDMSGLTVQQAWQRLIDDGYEERADGISLTVVLPYEHSFTVTGNDVGLKLDAAEAAYAAYNFGRDGSFFANEIDFIRAWLGRIELNELSRPDYDTSVIRELANEYSQKFNESLYDNDIEIGDEYIRIVKGTGYMPATANDVYNFAEIEMQRAIEENTHREVNFIPQEDTGEPIDFRAIYDDIFLEPVTSYYDPILGNPGSETYDSVNLGATESRVGQMFDLQAAEETYREAPNGSVVTIPIIKLEPEFTQEELKGMLFRDVLGEREAGQSSPASRNNNIRLAAEAIDGLVMQPGDVFSYNTVVGPRTRDRGYQEANAYVGGVLTPEVGGGICQVSSAIYAALLQTDLEIVHRQPHPSVVGYLGTDGYGQDATVSYGTIDFKFKNSSDYPIRLDVETLVTSTGYITVAVKIYGTRVSDVYYQVRSIEHESSPIKMIIIERPVTPEDEIELAPGQSHVLSPGNSGSIWEVWKYHYSDPDFENPDNRILDNSGNHVRRHVNTTTYPMRQRVIIYNPDGWLPQQPEDDG